MLARDAGTSVFRTVLVCLVGEPFGGLEKKGMHLFGGFPNFPILFLVVESAEALSVHGAVTPKLIFWQLRPHPAIGCPAVSLWFPFSRAPKRQP